MPGYAQPVVVLKTRPNHVLHLILTLVSCGMWAHVWIVLTARYWHVVDYRDPSELPGMNRRTWATIAIMAALNVLGFAIGLGQGLAGQ